MMANVGLIKANSCMSKQIDGIDEVAKRGIGCEFNGYLEYLTI